MAKYDYGLTCPICGKYWMYKSPRPMLPLKDWEKINKICPKCREKEREATNEK